VPTSADGYRNRWHLRTPIQLVTATAVTEGFGTRRKGEESDEAQARMAEEARLREEARVEAGKSLPSRLS
jgi:hypothetical protein